MKTYVYKGYGIKHTGRKRYCFYNKAGKYICADSLATAMRYIEKELGK